MHVVCILRMKGRLRICMYARVCMCRRMHVCMENEYFFFEERKVIKFFFVVVDVYCVQRLIENYIYRLLLSKKNVRDML